MRPLLVLAIVAVSAFVLISSGPSAPWPATYRIDHVTRLDIRRRMLDRAEAYEERRGRYSNRLEALAQRRERGTGLWGACPRTPYDPYHGVATRR